MATIIDPAIIGLLGAVVGAAASFAGTAFSNWLILRKDREARTDQRRTELEKWRREQIREAVLNAASHLEIYANRWLRYDKSLEKAQNDPEHVKLNAEVKKWVLCLLWYFPDKSVPDYDALRELLLKSNHQSIALEEQAWALRQILIQLATKHETGGQ